MADSLPVFDYAQILPLGLRFPARMVVLPLAQGRVALVSPVPIDEACAAAIGVLGRVEFLIAPNLLHHLYLGEAARRYPEARVLAPSALGKKRPELRISQSLDTGVPPELAAAVDVVPIAGAPSIEEYAFFHRATRSLVLTDLVFNVARPEGWLAHVLFYLGGTHGRLAASRIWRLKAVDRAAFAASIERLLALPFDTLVMAHGDIVEHHARERLGQALAWARVGARRAPLGASEGASGGGT
jgi:hypothetical protein